MNTREKGRRNEFKCRDALLAQGYDVECAPMPTKWSKKNDLFSLWDVVAVRGDVVRFIQVKSNAGAPVAKREAMAAWPVPPFCSKEVWIYHDRVKEPEVRVWFPLEGAWRKMI